MERSPGTKAARETVRTGPWRELYDQLAVRDPADLDAGELINLPISHGEGRYHADEATLDALEAAGRVALRYAAPNGTPAAGANPNGSLRGIAGITNARGNVLGLMPHPERAAEREVGGVDGLRIFRSLERWLARQPAVAERRL